MIRKDNRQEIELIVISCYAISLILACTTKFTPFIIVTAAAYPIAFWWLQRKE